jgi:MFS family permease
MKFVVLIGIVSLFSDCTYEGARSITGPFLSLLGASATVVGIVAGFGELIGYALRLASGYWADRTQNYWAIVFVGYGLNLLAVPLLALAGYWEIAAILMVAERMGKAIRTPARDVMLSCASDSIGRGWGFGLHEALDQIGAICGPLIVAFALASKGSYPACFGLLLIPAIFALTFLFTAYQLYPKPHDLESAAVKVASKGFPRSFWLYVIATGCVAAGYADFPLVAYHFKKVATVPDSWIPVFYAVAMGVDALAALLFGRLFDRIGFSVLIVAVLLSALFAPLVFMGGFEWALVGMALWGVGMGAQESIMRAAIADLVPTKRLGLAFGLFNTCFGVFWFAGSAVMGVLYDMSVNTLVVFSVASQLIAVPILLLGRKKVAG